MLAHQCVPNFMGVTQCHDEVVGLLTETIVALLYLDLPMRISLRPLTVSDNTAVFHLMRSP